MKLMDLISDLGVGQNLTGNPEIKMVANDSRKIKGGGLFIAISGFKDEGVKYIGKAIENGAVAVILEEKYRGKIDEIKGVTYIYVKNSRLANLLIARSFYGKPYKDLIMIGVTGTNGKTTITYIIEEILKRAGLNVGVIGTINYRYSNKLKKADNTTPDALEIQSMLREMKGFGVDYVIMEVSSHALALDRVMPEDYKYAIFTNLSQDHLDFHRDMDDYFYAKLKLFRGLKEDSRAIINMDDPYGRKIPDFTSARITTYGFERGVDILGEVVSSTVSGTSFKINGNLYHTKLVGAHNVYNILASYAVVKDMGIEDILIKEVVETLKPVPGRFDRVENDKGYNVFVDYAHTPDALEKLLNAANSIKSGKIITVFGCGGDRDKGKRPLMGRVVEEKSDIAIVTSDNPRSEDPLAIIEDIKKGLRKNNHIIIPDRREAIYRAIELAGENDIVLIAGKGHEDYQILKDRTIHFDDKEVAMEAIKEIG